MPELVPAKQRQFAVEVVEALRTHGYQAYWAGGCVRDQFLQRTPGDYDVATDATPEQIRAVFGHRRTLAIGAAFGVITVLGPKDAGQVEVTTFRCDAGYSDGRHPDRVTFSSAAEDAQRRDFTINGMFYDPLAEQVIDYVGGVSDLEARIVRAIGVPRDRFQEDKLRMLRAVRFAALFDFQLDEATFAAIRDMAAEVTVVSAERIAAEIETMLVNPNRARAVALLRETGLLAVVLPEVGSRRSEVGSRKSGVGEETAESKHESCGTGKRSLPVPAESQNWERTVALLECLHDPTFALALAVLLHGAEDNDAPTSDLRLPTSDLARTIGDRWRLAKRDSERAAWLLAHWTALDGARRMPWSRLQPLLISDGIAELLALHEARSAIGQVDPADVASCRERLALPPAELNPPPLATGGDLIALGIPRGKIYAQLLDRLREAQLDGQIVTNAEAVRLAEKLWHEQRKA